MLQERLVNYGRLQNRCAIYVNRVTLIVNQGKPRVSYVINTAVDVL